MEYDEIINKLISKTEHNSQEWQKADNIPSGMVLNAEKVTKIFYTTIKDKMRFYLVEFSYLNYYSDFDKFYPEYTIRGSFMEDGVEIVSFDRRDLDMPMKMNTLMESIIKKYFNTENKINNFLDS